MDVIRGVLFKHGMPTLLVCALVSLVVALIELLLLLCAACFADHIRKAAKHRSLLFSPNQVSLYELKITITSLDIIELVLLEELVTITLCFI